jgi:thymidylate synthase ThyX
MELSSFDHPLYPAQVHIAKENSLDWATAAALYSRSTGSIVDVLEKVYTKRKRIIDTYYIGYGHASIGDMVDLKLFIEGVPIWFAFMIEHHSRFRGQESSTRYIDFSQQEKPYDSDVDVELFNESLALYKAATDKIYKQIVENNPSEDSPSALNAIKARTFDICRGMLPIACVTNVAWFGDLNSIRKHIYDMYCSPAFVEIRNETCRQLLMFLWDAINTACPEAYKNFDVYTQPTKLDSWVYPKYNPDIWSRGSGTIKGKLDFGSYRDLARHRVGRHTFDFEVVDEQDGYSPVYNSWYTAMWVAHKVKYIERDARFTSFHNTTLGHCVNFNYYAPIEAIDYVVPLRSKPTVHPTLRLIIDHKNLDFGMYGFCGARGDQTITTVS